MNKIYKVIWNATLGTWVAVSEITKGKTKSSKTNKTASVVGGVVVGLMVTFSPDAYAAWVNTSGTGQTSLGVNAQENSIAVGTSSGNATTTKNNGIAMGTNAQSRADDGIAVGRDASVGNDGYRSIAIGQGANVVSYADDGTVNSWAHSRDAIAFGTKAKVDYAADNSIAIGNNAKINGGYANSVALGVQATVSGTSSVALGSKAHAREAASIAIGGPQSENSVNWNQADSKGQSVGSRFVVVESNVTNPDNSSTIKGRTTTGITFTLNKDTAGNWATSTINGKAATSGQASALYQALSTGAATATGTQSIALGSSAFVMQGQGIAIGADSQSIGDQSVALGANTDVVLGF